MDGNPFIELAISLGIGLLVGLQREWTESSVAGIRTFPLIAAFGTMSALIATGHGGWIIAAGLVALAGLLVLANLARLRAGDIDPGLTTEVAALLLYGVGAYLVVGQMTVAVALGGTIAVLLHLKKPMHEFVAAVGEVDMKAIMQFALVTLVVLPILPNRGYGPFEALNPFKIWLMVVLIVGLGLCGYVLYTLCGKRTGVLLHGLIGGLISSTATAVNTAQQPDHHPLNARAGAQVIVISSATMFLRMLIIIGIVAVGSFYTLAGPLTVMFLATSVIAAVGFLSQQSLGKSLPPPSNPAQLRSALAFGLLYAVVILAVTAAKQYLGVAGLYLVAGISGLEGVDPFTLTASQMVVAHQLDVSVAWRGMLVAALVNQLVKAGIVGTLGSRQLLARIAVPFAVMLLAGIAVLWFWPR